MTRDAMRTAAGGCGTAMRCTQDSSLAHAVGRWWAIALIVTFGALILGGCAKQMLQAPMTPAPEVEAPSRSAAPSGGGPASMDETVAETASDIADKAAASERKLIRTGNMSIEVDDAEGKSNEIEQIAKGAGGFVGDTSMTRYDDGSLHASVQVRVPAGKFDSVLQELKRLGEVNHVSTDVRDVTAEYVDLEARIRNKKREEERLLELLEKSGKLADILEIEKALSGARETIERYEGQMRVLSEQIELSTIDVTLAEKGEAAVAEAGKYDVGYHIKSAIRSLVLILRGILTALIYIVIDGWVVWLPLLLIIWWVRRRRRARKAPPPMRSDAKEQ